MRSRRHSLQEDSSPLTDNADSSAPPLSHNVSHQSTLQGHSIPMPSADPYSHYQSDMGGRANSRHHSWDILAGVRKLEQSYEEFDSRNASRDYLAYADGDLPKDKVSKFYNYLINVSVVTRWILFIVPVLALLWIPGILGVTKYKQTTVWGVKLLFWSIWLSVYWVGWWASLAAAQIIPIVIRATVGVVAVGTRRYIDWFDALHRYVAIFIWSCTAWIAFNPLIDKRIEKTATQSSRTVVSTIAKLLFGILLCAGLLLFEKFSIQWIAGKFHERSYAERIADQKFAVKTLVTLYRNSSDVAIPRNPSSDLDNSFPSSSSYSKADKPFLGGKKIFKKAIKGVRGVATTTTSAFGNVASEITGTSVLQPNSPGAMVKTALESSNKSLKLARRIFFSFRRKGNDVLLVEDIEKYFGGRAEAESAFALFDQDGNGDATRDEVEMACMGFHREQLSIEHSMQDLSSAVGRLDNIFMSLYVIVALLILAVALEAQLLTIITSAGTLILGLSWLIGSSLAEVLTSIIFLFIKHPFDVGDRVVLPGNLAYTVKEIRLLSTVFLDGTGVVVQAPNSALNAMFIQNIRRSAQMSEPFSFDVAYTTTFLQLEHLRAKMIAFLENESRDYQPQFDVSVVDFPDQAKMTCKAEIKYKSNWQQTALKARRRNKWICYLKIALAQCAIYGPSGDPAPDPKAVTKYTIVPWEEVQKEERNRAVEKPVLEKRPTGGWNLIDKKAPMMEDSDDIFNHSVPGTPGPGQQPPPLPSQTLRQRTGTDQSAPPQSEGRVNQSAASDASLRTAEMFEMAPRSERGEGA